MKLFNEQRKRLFPTPTYDMSDSKVAVEIVGRMTSVPFAQMLLAHPELNAAQILMLDRVAKGLLLTEKELCELIELGLVSKNGDNIEIVKPLNGKHINTSDVIPAKITSESTPSDKQNVVSNVVSNVASPIKCELTERQIIVFAQIEHNNYVTIDRMSQALGVTRRTIDRELAVLRKLGYIKKESKDNKSPWLVLKRP